jgi:cell division septum initiation protein DivIVA
MTGQEIRRADELLTELVELVETARSVPISGSCVIPREHTLDLLDDLREVLPPEMAQAQQIVSQRDSVLASAQEQATELRERTAAEAEAVRAQAMAAAAEYTAAAEQHAAELISAARAEAAGLVEAGEVENARLISSAGVHEAATVAARQLREEADLYVAASRSDADAYANHARSAADHYAMSLRSNAEDYAEATLGEIVATLQRTTATAERGRAELAARRNVANNGASGVSDPNSTGLPGHDLFDGQAPQ